MTAQPTETELPEDDADMLPPADHNAPKALNQMSAAEIRGLRDDVGRTIARIVDRDERIKQLQEASRGEIKGLEARGLNKKAIKEGIRLEKINRTGNADTTLDGYDETLQIVRAALGIPIEADGQLGMILETSTSAEPSGLREIAVSLPANPLRDGPGEFDARIGTGAVVLGGAKFPVDDKGNIVGRGHVVISPPAQPTIKPPVKEPEPETIERADYQEHFVAGQRAYLNGESFDQCPLELVGRAGDAWEEGWKAAQAETEPTK